MNLGRKTSLKKLIIGSSQQISRFFKFCGAVFSHFNKDHGFILASSMVFSTLIAMVPFLAFMMILLGDLKIIDTSLLKELINDNIALKILPANQHNITNYIDNFTQNAATLGWMGLIIFLISSIFLIKKVNDTFNLIFKIIPKQGMMARLATYVSGMIIGTFFLGITSTLFMAITEPLQIWLASHHLLDTTTTSYRFLTELVPWLVLFFGLFLMFKMVPSARVKWRSALIASLFGTFAWQITNIVFSWAISKMFTYEKIYGPLATAIIFLIWVNIMWIIVYLSLEIAYVHQHRTHLLKNQNNDIQNPFNRYANAFDILKIIVEGFSIYPKPVTASDINDKLELPEALLIKLLKELEHNNFILKTADKPSLYIPARALDHIKIEELIASLYGSPKQRSQEASFGSKNAYLILKSAQKAYHNKTAQNLISTKKEFDDNEA